MAKATTKALVANASPDLLAYITAADETAEGVDLFSDKFHLTVRGCYHAKVPADQCGRIIYAMFQAWHAC